MDNNDHQYVTFYLNNANEGIQIDHEEVYEPIEEYVVHQSITEVLDENVNQDIIETKIALKISNANSEQEEPYSFVYPIYVKKDTKQFATGDESMAIEALRQLGGMYPNIEDGKLSCLYCSNIFTETELIEHRLVCDSVKHICKICDKVFQKKIDLNNHMSCHQSKMSHACRICGYLFSSKANLQSHMIKVHQVKQIYKCKICGTDFCRPSSLSNHMKIHNYVAGRAIMQTQSNVAVQTVETINQEPISSTIQSIQNIGIPQAEWTMQTYNFTPEKNNINNLTKSSVKINALQEVTVLPNEEIAQIEYILQDSVNHELNQHLNLNSDNNSEPAVKLLSFESQIENESYSCNKCKISFASKTSLTKHEKDHMESNMVVASKCKYCNEEFQDGTSLILHQIPCSKKSNENSQKKVNTNLSNTQRSKHACSNCGKKFTTKQKMFRHQWIHRKKIYSCEACNSQFEKQLELDEHRLLVHLTESPFTCNECGKRFVSRQGLWEHGRTHAGSPSHFHCNICSKTFSSRQGYLIHHRTHTGERPYGCKFCWKAFRDGGTLRKHERIHTGERPHVCPLCSRAFNQKVVLREHVRWVHAAKNESASSGPPFSCPLCEDSTQDRDELCAHIVKHSDLMTAEAKAKSKCLKTKTKVKKKISKQLNIVKEQSIEHTKDDEEEFSFTQHNDHSTETENTYLILKQGLDNTLSIQACSNKVFSTSKSPIPTSRDTVTDVLDEVLDLESQEKTDILHKESSLNATYLETIPRATKRTQQDLVPAMEVNTLTLISKHNEKLPVITIPNSQTIISLSSGLSNIGVSLSSKNNVDERIFLTEKSILDKSEKIVCEDESEKEKEELLCGICGKESNNKNTLMEHVKIHI